MDAHVRNKCEREILAILHEIANELKTPIKIEAEAHAEGGLRDIWKILGDNEKQITLLIAIAALVISITGLPDSKDSELKQLSIEEKKLIIQKLKSELETKEPNSREIEIAARTIGSSPKIKVRKSNLYQEIRGYEKIEQIGTSRLDAEGFHTAEELKTERRDFHKAIMESRGLPSLPIEGASIEIVAPVLHEGRHKWKGIYEKKLISFDMNDNDFRNDVIGERVSFQHGTIIECVLMIERELDETGEIKIKDHIVKTVLKKYDGSSTTETAQGKRYLATKKAIESQTDMFPSLDRPNYPL
jgi:hypothetical protein